jgi:hypothetical protein
MEPIFGDLMKRIVLTMHSFTAKESAIPRNKVCYQIEKIYHIGKNKVLSVRN